MFTFVCPEPTFVTFVVKHFELERTLKILIAIRTQAEARF
jgi:hypothetical protein